MIRLPHPACVWTVNLLVPGAGLVMLGRVVLGSVLALIWGSSAACFLRGLIWPDSVTVQSLLLPLTPVCVFYVAWQAVLFGALRSAAKARLDPARDEKFKAALASYLQGRYDEAESLCRELLRLDPDDVEATLQLATIARQRGNAATARRQFERARYLDDDGRWDFEIGRELAGLRSPASPSAGG